MSWYLFYADPVIKDHKLKVKQWLNICFNVYKSCLCNGNRDTVSLADV